MTPNRNAVPWTIVVFVSIAGAACGAATSTGNGGGGAGQGGGGGTPSGSTSSASIQCFDSTQHLVQEAKACTADTDCTSLPTSTCCGPSVIVGMAKTQVATYSACYPVPKNCPPLGCASQATAEDGQPVPMGETVQVRCVDSGDGTKLCKTSKSPADAGMVDGG